MLKELPRVKIANLPTPLHEVKRLSELLGGPKILFKRDDATGLALGGQKARMLEFPLGDAVAKGCDVIVSVGSEDSNLATFVAAAARRLGMDVILVFLERQRTKLAGNALLINLLDPVVIQTELGHALEGRIASKRMVGDVVDELRERGRHPYVIEYGESEVPLESIGYFYCAQEIVEQLKEMGETAQYLYVANASGLTQGGLVLGAKYFHAPFKVIGILTIAEHKKEERQLVITKVANEASKCVGAGITIEPDEIILSDEYIGEAWGPLKQTTKECIEAIRLVAKTEGIFLDPHYTGKAMAALIDDIRGGKLSSKDTVIFHHTGGVPIIFPYYKELQAENRTSYKDM